MYTSPSSQPWFLGQVGIVNWPPKQLFMQLTHIPGFPFSSLGGWTSYSALSLLCSKHYVKHWEESKDSAGYPASPPVACRSHIHFLWNRYDRAILMPSRKHWQIFWGFQSTQIDSTLLCWQPHCFSILLTFLHLPCMWFAFPANRKHCGELTQLHFPWACFLSFQNLALHRTRFQRRGLKSWLCHLLVVFLENSLCLPEPQAFHL